MARSALTGSRIRERRTFRGMKQSELARAVGISPSYLNLIEHNRRKIGGKLVMDIAKVLRTDVTTLTQGAEAALVEALRDAAAGSEEGGEATTTPPETDRIDEFVGRFPGWAALLAAERDKVGRLERTVEALTDRLTHDPFLSASLHDVLSTVTAIRSTSTILVDDPEIDATWRRRFHTNLHDDSVRLAEASQSLVRYLDDAGEADTGTTSPQEEFEAYLAARRYHIAELERALPPSFETILNRATDLSSSLSRALAEQYLTRYARDAQRMPLEDFQTAAAAMAYDPGRLAERFAVDLASVFRRLASLPIAEGEDAIGLVICDGSGALTFRKPIDGFPLPRFGAACPLWPLYQALARPMTPVRAVVELPGRNRGVFLTYAISQPANPTGFDGPQVYEAAMLVLSKERATLPPGEMLVIGTSCRICPRAACAARREPSVLSEDF